MSGETDSTVWQAYRENLKTAVYGAGELTVVLLLSILTVLWLFAPMVAYVAFGVFGQTPETWTLAGAVIIAEVVWVVVIAGPLFMILVEDDQ